MSVYKIFTLQAIIACFILSASPSSAENPTAIDLIHAQGCKGCHSINNNGGILGPPLDEIGLKLTHKQIRQKLINPKTGNPSSVMPDSRHLSEQEVDLMTDYLTRLR